MSNEKKITKVFFLASAFAIGFVTCAVAMVFLFMDAFGSENSVELGMRKLTDPLKKQIGLARRMIRSCSIIRMNCLAMGHIFFIEYTSFFPRKKRSRGGWRELKDFGDIVKIVEVRMGGVKRSGNRCGRLRSKTPTNAQKSRQRFFTSSAAVIYFWWSPMRIFEQSHTPPELRKAPRLVGTHFAV
jgi:hypothetical protein